MKDIAVVMITMDRTPRKNYLRETLKNLERSGLYGSSRLHSFSLVDSGSDNLHNYLKDQEVSSFVEVHPAQIRRVARENVAEALAIGAARAPWVLFCEDDIDVCDNFINSVGLWLDTNGLQEDRRLFVFGASFIQIKHRWDRGYDTWSYPVTSFYGTQCFAIRAADAADLSEYLKTHRLVRGVDAPGAYDMSIQEWAVERYPSYEYFTASAPSFVQHLGKDSALNNKFFTFPAWAGREWSYRGGVVRL